MEACCSPGSPCLQHRGTPSLLCREAPACCTPGSPQPTAPRGAPCHTGDPPACCINEPPAAAPGEPLVCHAQGAPACGTRGTPNLPRQRAPAVPRKPPSCRAQGAPILPSESPHCTQGGLSLPTAGRQCWGGLCQLRPRDTGCDIALDRKSRKLLSQCLCRGSQGPNHDPGEVLILLPLPCLLPSSSGSQSSGISWGKVGSAQARWQLTSSERSRPISCACSRSFAFRVSTCQHRQG